MKIHTRKKAFRAECKRLARDGKIVIGTGQWINRDAAADNSMKRDFWPQAGKGKG